MQTIDITKVKDQQLNEQIDQFANLVTAGIRQWEQAGELLVKLVGDDRDAFAKIIKRYPTISLETLQLFDKIGRKQIFAPLVADKSLGARALLEMPYEVQKRLYTEPVKVAVGFKSGHVVTKEKPVRELSKKEVSLVFGKDKVRNIEQQAFIIKHAPVEKQKREENMKTVDMGYYSLTCSPEGKIEMTQCAKSPIAQPVRVIPNGTGWRSAIIIFYRTRE